MVIKTFINGQENGVITFKGDTEPCAVYVNGEKQDNISYVPQEVTGENSVEYSSEYKKNIRTMQIDGNTVQEQRAGGDVTLFLELYDWVNLEHPQIESPDLGTTYTSCVYWNLPFAEVSGVSEVYFEYMGTLNDQELNIVIAYTQNDLINRTGSYQVLYPYTKPVVVDQPFYIGAINPNGYIDEIDQTVWQKYINAITESAIHFITVASPSPYAPSPIQNAGDNQLLVSNAVTLNNVNIGATKLETFEGSKCLYFAIEGGKKYTISLAKCSRLSACTSGAFPRLRTPIYDRADAGTLTPSATPTTLVVNATENLSYLIIRYYNSTTDTYSEQEILDTLSVEVNKPISVNLLGANLFDIDTVLGTMGTIVDSVRLGWTQQADGSWYCFNIGMIIGERIFTNTEQKQGKLTLLVNQKTRTTGTNTGLTYAIVYLDGTTDSLKVPSNTEFQDYSITSNPNKTVDFIDLRYSSSYGTYIKYLMINWGDVMPYEPYRKQSVSLPSSVTVDGQEVELRMGGLSTFANIPYRSHILVDRIRNKVFYYEYQKVYSPQWVSGRYSVRTNVAWFRVAGIGTPTWTAKPKKSTHFSLVSSVTYDRVGFSAGDNSPDIYFSLPLTMFADPTNPTVTEANTWLQSEADKGTPVTFLTTYAEPLEYDLTETEIGQQILDFVNSTQNATNIIEITSTPSVSNISVNYAKWGGIPNANNT